MCASDSVKVTWVTEQVNVYVLLMFDAKMVILQCYSIVTIQHNDYRLWN